MAEVTKPLKVGNVWTNLIDSNSGDSPNFEIREYDLDGVTPLTDLSCDGILYRKDPEGGYAVDTEYINTTVVNVKRFGAKGDGTTDDTTAIQAAFDSSPKKAKIFFPVGVYRITRTIIIPDGKELVILGSDKVSYGGTTWSTPYNGISSIAWFGEDSQYTAAMQSNAAVFRGSIKYLNFSNRTGRTDVDGIVLNDFRGSQIEFVHLNLFRENIKITGSCWWGIFNRVISSSAVESNIHIIGTTNGLVFNDCRIDRSGGEGLVIENAGGDINFNNCYFEDNEGYAIRAVNILQMSISQCHFENSGLGLTENAGQIRITPYTSVPNVPINLSVIGCNILTRPGIDFVKASGGTVANRGRLMTTFIANQLIGGAVEGDINTVYMLGVVANPENITATFINNSSRSQLDPPVIPQAVESREDLRSITFIGDGLSPASTVEIMESSRLRTNRLHLSDGLDSSATGPSVISGIVAPEGITPAQPGSIYIHSAANYPQDMLYIKGSGSGTSGWVPYKDTRVVEMLSGDLNDIITDTIVSVPASSTVTNKPATPTADGFVITYRDSTSNRSRQMWLGRSGEMWVRSGANGTSNRYEDGWTQLVRQESGDTASRPTVRRHTGDIYFDTDLGHPVWWDGTDWVNALPDIPNATTTTKGLVNQMGAISNVDVGDAVVADDCIPLANANKAKIDQILIAMRGAGMLDT